MCTNSHTFRWDTIAREWLERKQNLIRAEFAKAKVSVKEKSNETNGEKSIDPKNPFHGSRLSNNQNICYLNSTINALLSLRSFREFLMISDPTGIVKAFRMVLNGSKTGDAETIRQLLQHKFTENFSFNYNEQVFAGDAINCVINYLDLDRICNYSVSLRRKCLDCHHEFSEKKYINASNKKISAEIMRGEIFRFCNYELPYVSKVEIVDFKYKGKLIYLNSSIWVKRNSQKIILLGSSGNKLKKILTHSRIKLEKLFKRKIFIDCTIKISNAQK